MWSKHLLVVTFALAVSAAPVVSFAEAEHGYMSLLQQYAQATSGDLGDKVPLSEKGYQLVAALKSDEEMKHFVHRLLEKEGRYVKEVAELNGLVPFYSGTQNVQNVENLKKELRSALWVAEGEGRTAPLNEVGYQKVAKLKSKSHMMAYSRRLLDGFLRKCSDEGALKGVVPYFNGEISVQSFEQLKKELLSAPWAVARDSEQVLSAVTLPVALKEEGKVSEKIEIHVGNECTEAADEATLGFKRFDVDGDGFISAAELKQTMEGFDQKFSEEAIDEMFRVADVNGDGQISCEEFKTKMTE